MRDVLARLEKILDRLSVAESLTAEEVGLLAHDWDAAMGALEKVPHQEAAAQALPTSERIYLRVRLERIIKRVPEVQKQLMAHKSSVAQQIFTENRRFQSLQSRYAASFGGSARLRHKA